MARQQEIVGFEQATDGKRRRSRGKLKVHDPFELVRWLALSQPDPRKALSELVQNSLDARAGTVRVTRYRRDGLACLSVWDDGEGVVPELSRPEALRYIATHIGHSRKRSLTPRERLELMTQGQYGIGLLGFWSLGERLEMRSFVPGEAAYRLVLYRERPDYEIEQLRLRKPGDHRWTEVVVAGLNQEALQALIARRAADFLGSELRGQLLQRDVQLLVRDRIARGRAAKRLRVEPRRFVGERIEGLGAVAVEGYPAAQLELFFAGNRREAKQPIALYAAGTLVAESFADLGALRLDREPWTDRRLTGMVDFPMLTVAPGSRRGVVPDAATTAFAEALRSIEPILEAVLRELEQRRAEQLDRSVVRDLKRAYRHLYRQLPRYSLLPVTDDSDQAAGPEPTDDGVGGAGDGEPAADRGSVLEPTDLDLAEPSSLAEELLPAGPLERLELRPRSLSVVEGGHRTVRALAFDEIGRRIDREIELSWSLPSRLGTIEPTGGVPPSAQLEATPSLDGDRERRGELRAVAREGDIVVEATAQVRVVEPLSGKRSDEGIPDPELIDAPGADWHSRMRGERWQVNSGHPQYRAVADNGALKLRYLSMLFAKEVVLRSAANPALDGPLEQLIEVTAYADHEIHSRRGGR